MSIRRDHDMVNNIDQLKKELYLLAEKDKRLKNIHDKIMDLKEEIKETRDIKGRNLSVIKVKSSKNADKIGNCVVRIEDIQKGIQRLLLIKIEICERYRKLFMAVNTLKERERNILYMYYEKDKTCAQIATELNCTKYTASTYLERAEKNLFHTLTQMDDGLDIAI